MLILAEKGRQKMPIGWRDEARRALPISHSLQGLNLGLEGIETGVDALSFFLFGLRRRRRRLVRVIKVTTGGDTGSFFDLIANRSGLTRHLHPLHRDTIAIGRLTTADEFRPVGGVLLQGVSQQVFSRELGLNSIPVAGEVSLANFRASLGIKEIGFSLIKTFFNGTSPGDYDFITLDAGG